jgi:hypothetical protein
LGHAIGNLLAHAGVLEVFRKKRGDTTVGSIEGSYGIEVNARDDMLLRNLLDERGFESQTQFLEAYYGRLSQPAARRRVFISFHKEDAPLVRGLRLMANNPKVELEFYDNSLRDAIRSEDKDYVKRKIRYLINRASVLICILGNGTAWREWVEWEIKTAVGLGKGICGVRISGTYGKVPELMKEVGAPIAVWSTESIIRAIECAAARRS